MKSKVVSNESFTTEVKNFLRKILILINSQQAKQKVAFLISNSPRTSSSPLLMLTTYQPENRTENIVKQLIIQEAFKLEKNHAFSAPIMINYLKYFYELMERLEKTKSPQSKIDSILSCKLDNLLVDIQSSLSRPTMKDLSLFFDNQYDKKTKSLIFEILKLAGPAGKINFNHENINQTIIESRMKYSFDIKPDENIMILNKLKWKRSNVSTVAMERFIENVSEIDIILNEASKKKTPLLILCLGYSQEVISTIVLNNKRKTFDVMIATPCKDADAMNDLTDMTTIFGTPFHGYQTGPISSIFSPEDLDVTCEEISILPKNIFIKNSKSFNAVQQRLKRLQDRLGDHNVGSALGDNTLMDDYLRRRIECLTSHQVRVTLPEENAQKKFSSIEKIDEALRAAKSIIKYGIIDFKNRDNIVESGVYNAASVYLGIKFGYKLSKQILSIKNAIIFDT